MSVLRWLRSFLLHRRLERDMREEMSRLCARYPRMAAAGRAPLFIATTIGRELLGFMWAIGQQIEAQELRAAS